MSSLGSPNPFFIAGKKAYEVERSLRFNDDDGASLTRTQSTSPTNSKKGTLSFWVKRGNLGNSQHFYNVYADNNNRGIIYFRSDVNALQIGNQSGGSFYSIIRLNRLFRDSSAWYHIVIGFDTTQGTAADRIKVYVNGSQETSFHTSNYPSQNDDIVFFNRANVKIGAAHDNQANEYFDGYATEFNYIDGFQYDPSYFGETDVLTGQWNPKKYTGSYGTNGFYLNFSDNSGTTATTLGKDSSGNGNNFTPNNFAVSDAVKDSPTNNFATLDVLAESGGTYSEGNLKVVGTSDPSSSTIGFASSKFYYEAYIDATSNIYVGVIPIDYGLNPARGGGWDHGAIAYRSSGQQYKLKAGGGYSSVSASYGASYTAGDIIGCAVDIDNDTVTFYKNGVSQGNTSDGVSYITASGTTSIYGVIVYCNGGNNTFRVNFGQDSTFQGTVSAGGNTDANGIGDFKYTVPSGYKALCSANLPDPTIKLPNKHFEAKTYIGGDGSAVTISLDFSPDWTWLKSRSSVADHGLYDTVRGVNARLRSNSAGAEDTVPGPIVSNTGFTLNAPGYYNPSSGTPNMISWNWNAGDTDSKTYAVTVVSDSGNKYRFDGFGTSAVTLDLAEGGTYVFNMDDASNASHPFSIGTAANGTVYTSGITYFLDGVSKTYSEYTSGFAAASTRRLHITVPASAPVLYYWCSAHSGMGGQINTNTSLGSSNFDGTIQTTVKANTTAGFSIITHSGNDVDGATIGHGLGVPPVFRISKSRNLGTVGQGGAHWTVNHQSLTGGMNGGNSAKELFLNLTNAESPNYHGTVSAVSSTTMTLKNGSNNDVNAHINHTGGTYVTYCFSEVAGYSKFGSYTGNGSSDGTFVFTGFRPAFVLIKGTSDGSAFWTIIDNKRNTFNRVDKWLYPNDSQAEYNASSYPIDFLANGFKVNTNASYTNTSGGTYIYLAFAESPFKYARAR